MKLVYPDYSFQFIFKENTINTLVIENPKHFAFIVNELYNQYKGNDGRFVLSEELNILDISSCINMIINLFDMDFDQRKILTGLYKSLDYQLNDSTLHNEFINLQMDVFSLIEKLSMEMFVDFDLEYNDNISLIDLLKMLNVKIGVNDEALVEKIIDYIKVSLAFLNTKLFVFVNLKLYLDEKEINDFIKFVNYQKAHVLLLEAYKSDYSFSNEIQYVIDKDLCEIY